jgi:UMF1 family MFS transporter
MNEPRSRSPESGLLARLGLPSPELKAWALYDWANSAFVLTVQTAIYPIYFLSVVGADLPAGVAAQRHSWATSAALLIVAVMAPFLGAVADYAARKKHFFAAFLAFGVASTAALYFVQRGDWLLAMILFAMANIGAQGSFVFYDSLLPHIVRSPQEMDRASTAGYALGYFGSTLLLALQLGWILAPERFGLPAGTLPTRLAFLSVAVWWVAFSLPLFRRVPEPARQLEEDERPGQSPTRVALSRLRETLGEIRAYRQAFLMIIAFLIYNDGIGTIIRMATTYGTEIGIGATAQMVAILLVQIVGVPFAFLFGRLSGRIGPKRAILLGLLVYVFITSSAYFMRTTAHFFVLAILVGMVQGGCQALSRSLFASMIPRHKTAEFFGFYGVLDKFAGILGPFLFGLTIALTGSSRPAILPVILFFVVGGLILSRIDVEEGRRVARKSEEALLSGS